MILRLLRDQLLYQTNQKGATYVDKPWKVCPWERCILRWSYFDDKKNTNKKSGISNVWDNFLLTFVDNFVTGEKWDVSDEPNGHALILYYVYTHNIYI